MRRLTALRSWVRCLLQSGHLDRGWQVCNPSRHVAEGLRPSRDLSKPATSGHSVSLRRSPL